ncbi:MAG TPA: UTP--glucose-1-phosphate uridylyltransferase GalU [Acidimicrobiales bacterium]|nr:UTP--glucose-1-phosphate uridylyltransferase GalU [Acidimicrobiales bacterium]
MSVSSDVVVRKAVIPAAGRGTRFLPFTKATPKEMLPIIDRPTMEYIVAEAAGCGIDDVLVITSRGKVSIEDHFDQAPELEAALAEAGKTSELEMVRASSEMARVHFVRQGVALGLGHAIGQARDHVGDESFAVLLGDDVLHPDSDVLSRMISTHERTGAHVIALMEVPPDEVSLYGCVEATEIGPGLVQVHSMVEKPPPEEAPSNLAMMGRYVFGPSIFDAIDATPPGRGGEIQITDAIASFTGSGEVYGVVFSEGRYDVGSKADYLRAIVEFACEREDLGPDFEAFLVGYVRGRGLLD